MSASRALGGALALALLAAPAGAAHARARPGAGAGVVTALDSVAAALASDRFMGAVLVARGDRVLVDRAVGEANLEWGVPNTTETRFRIGSLTKQFTAAAVMLLAQAGVLGTRDTITRWIPEAGPGWDHITVHELLTHTAGVPDVDAADEFWPATSGLSPGRQAVLRFREQPLDFEPGTSYAYSNTGYLVLAAIVEAASGVSYERFVAMNLLEPLGLGDTGFDSAAPLLARRAAGYVSQRDTVTNAPCVDMRLLDAAGGLYSTTHDLLRWTRALFGGRVLGAAALAEMTAPGKGDYACGIHHRTAGRELYYHTGRVNGFESALGYYPADSLTVVVLANLDGSHVEHLFDRLAAAAHAAPAAR